MNPPVQDAIEGNVMYKEHGPAPRPYLFSHFINFSFAFSNGMRVVELGDRSADGCGVQKVIVQLSCLCGVLYYNCMD